MKYNQEYLTQVVSGFLLYQNLPDEWTILSDEQMKSFIDKHKLDWLRNADPFCVAELIEELGFLMFKLYKMGVEEGETK